VYESANRTADAENLRPVIRMLNSVLSRFGRGALAALGFCFLSIVMPAVYELVERMDALLAEPWNATDSNNLWQALMIDPAAIQAETCDDSCEHMGIKPLTYFVPRATSAVLCHARLVLEAQRVFEAPEGGYFTNLNIGVTAGYPGAYFNTRGDGDTAERLMDEVLSTSEILPVRLEKEGYFVAWQRSDAAIDEPEVRLNSAEGQTHLLPTARFRRLTFQPVARVFSAVLTDIQFRDVAPNSRIVLFTEPGRSLQYVFNSRGMITATITAVTQGTAGELLAHIEPLSNGDRTGIYEHWMTARLDQRSDITQLSEQGVLAIILPPENTRSDGSLHLESELYQMPRVPMQIVPKSAIDAQCSIDRAPSTGCLWSFIAGEIVPVQVQTIALADGQVAVLERALFAGDPISPAHWQRLSAAVRREWISRDSGKSVLENRRVLEASPERIQ